MSCDTTVCRRWAKAGLNRSISPAAASHSRPSRTDDHTLGTMIATMPAMPIISIASRTGPGTRKNRSSSAPASTHAPENAAARPSAIASADTLRRATNLRT